MEETCKECNKKFSLARNLRRHMINIHKISPEPLTYDENVKMYKCLECSCSFKINQDLIYHLEIDHGLLIEREELTFENKADFASWKRKIEKQDSCKYTLIHGGKSKHDEHSNITKYVCNKKDPKQNCVCISDIKVIKDPNGDNYVARIKTHYGHDTKSSTQKKRNETIVATDTEINMEEDYIETNNTEKNMKTSIKTMLDILLENLDQMDNKKLDNLNSCLDTVCHKLNLPTQKDYGQIIISSNSNFDHNYF